MFINIVTLCAVASTYSNKAFFQWLIAILSIIVLFKIPLLNLFLFATCTVLIGLKFCYLAYEFIRITIQYNFYHDAFIRVASIFGIVVLMAISWYFIAMNPSGYLNLF